MKLKIAAIVLQRSLRLTIKLGRLDAIGCGAIVPVGEPDWRPCGFDSAQLFEQVLELQLLACAEPGQPLPESQGQTRDALGQDFAASGRE